MFDKAEVICDGAPMATLECGSNGKWIFPNQAICKPQGAIGRASQYWPDIAHILIAVVISLVFR